MQLYIFIFLLVYCIAMISWCLHSHSHTVSSKIPIVSFHNGFYFDWICTTTEIVNVKLPTSYNFSNGISSHIWMVFSQIWSTKLIRIYKTETRWEKKWYARTILQNHTTTTTVMNQINSNINVCIISFIFCLAFTFFSFLVLACVVALFLNVKRMLLH